MKTWVIGVVFDGSALCCCVFIEVSDTLTEEEVWTYIEGEYDGIATVIAVHDYV